VKNNYEHIDLEEWNKWFEKFVAPVFNIEGRDTFYDWLKKHQVPFFPKYWIAEKFYEKIKLDSRFDEELKLFFSFLYSCGFFMDNIIDFEKWLSIKNWERPWIINDESEANNKSIIEILNQPFGERYLKNRLPWFPYLDRPEGS
jgi:hypothetical protein